MVDRTLAPFVAALEEHRLVTASLVEQLDGLAVGEAVAERLMRLFAELLRHQDRALGPLVEQLAVR